MFLFEPCFLVKQIFNWRACVRILDMFRARHVFNLQAFVIFTNTFRDQIHDRFSNKCSNNTHVSWTQLVFISKTRFLFFQKCFHYQNMCYLSKHVSESNTISAFSNVQSCFNFPTMFSSGFIGAIDRLYGLLILLASLLFT